MPLTVSNSSSRLPVVGRPFSSTSGCRSTTSSPGRANTFGSTSTVRPVVTAKETSVGGTSRSSKLPDMESLPPMAATPRHSYA